MKTIGKIFIALIVMAFAINECNAQWAMGKGHAYIKLGTYATASDQKYDHQGNIVPLQSFEGQSVLRSSFLRTSVYARVGIDDKWTVVGTLPRVRVNHNGNVKSGLGDMNLTLERNILKKPFQAAVQLTLGLPTGKTDDPGFNTGDGEFNQSLRFVVGNGWKLGPLGMYSKAGISYNNRTKGFADQYKFGAETGTKILNGRLLLLVRYSSLNFVNSQDDGAKELVNGTFSEFGTNFEAETFSYQASYNFAGGWSVSYGKVMGLSGKNVLATGSEAFGLIYKF